MREFNAKLTGGVPSVLRCSCYKIPSLFAVYANNTGMWHKISKWYKKFFLFPSLPSTLLGD